MKGREIRLINQLRKNSRRSLTKISIDAGMPLTTAFKILKRLEGRTIRKNICLVNFAQLGYAFKVCIFLSTNSKDELKNLLTDQPNINTFLRLSGDFDYYAEFLFKDMAGYKDLIDELNDSELVKKMSIHFVTDVKKEEFQIGKEEVSENEKEY